VARSQERLPRFPSRKACFDLRAVFGDTECVCRIYPARGFYVVGACGHAHGWDLARGDAEAQAKRLNEGAEDLIPALQGPVERVGVAPPPPSKDDDGAGDGAARHGRKSVESVPPNPYSPRTSDIPPRRLPVGTAREA
jgi:hypothetical protein